MQTGCTSGPILSLESLTDGRFQPGPFPGNPVPAPFQGIGIPFFQSQPAFQAVSGLEFWVLGFGSLKSNGVYEALRQPETLNPKPETLNPSLLWAG
jgi:hypothetical protein